MGDPSSPGGPGPAIAVESGGKFWRVTGASFVQPLQGGVKSVSPPRALPGRPLVVLALACLAFLLVWGLFAALTPIVEADEARYVQVAREMMAGGNWLALRLHGEAYNQKPPVPFWMIALALKGTGGELVEWVVRMPSAILAAATLALCGWIGWRRYGPDAGICATLMLGSMVQFLNDAPKVELNVPLTFWTTLSVAFWLTRRKDHRFSRWRAVGLWGALTLAILTKGPLALLVVGAVLVADALESGGIRRLRLLHPVLGGTGVLLALAGYLGALALANGGGFVERMLRDALVDRVIEGDHAAPWFFYLAKLPVSILMPWTPILLAVLWHAWRRRRRDAFGGACALVAWVAVPLLVLSLAHGKRESYTVPLLPGFALLFAWFLFGTNEGLAESRRLLATRLKGLVPLLPGPGRGVGAVACVTVAAALVFEATVTRAEAIRDSPHRFGARLTDYMRRHGEGRLLGAFEKADGCEYYSYASVDVRELEIEHPSQVDPSRWPDVITGRKSDWRKFADTAILNGYVPVLSDEAAGERIHVWARVPGQTRHARVAMDVLGD